VLSKLACHQAKTSAECICRLPFGCCVAGDISCRSGGLSVQLSASTFSGGPDFLPTIAGSLCCSPHSGCFRAYFLICGRFSGVLKNLTGKILLCLLADVGALCDAGWLLRSWVWSHSAGILLTGTIAAAACPNTGASFVQNERWRGGLRLKKTCIC
jgi:hypothetical protein